MKTTTKKRLASRVLVAALAIGLGAAATAQAAPDDLFTPEFSFSTSTDQAGAHPDLMTVAMRKQLRNRCVDPPNPSWPGNLCIRQYIEQNVKRMTVHFPPGALPDPNAAPYCGLRHSLYPPPMDVAMPEVYYCENEDALVGFVDVTSQFCDLALEVYALNMPDDCQNTQLTEPFGCPDPEAPPPEGFTNYPAQPPSEGYTYQCRSLGYVYNEAPRLDDNGLPTEQGHLVVLLPRWAHPDDAASWIEQGITDGWNDPIFYERIGGYASNNVAHISVRVRKSDLGIDAIAEVPDWVPTYTGPYPAQISDMVLTLFGNTGAVKGHPLITNPTYCDPATVDAEIQGYAHNSGFAPGSLSVYQAGFGDGSTATGSVGVQSTGCDQVPYKPNIDLKLSTTKAGEVPAVEATVTQPQGEATTQSSTVAFPSGFKVNDKNKATYCGDADIQRSVDDPDADHCPESSRIGTVEASSYVLPEWEPPLKGGVYLKGLTGDSVEFSALLEGFVDVRFDAKAKLGDDLTLTNRFEGLPSVPLSKFVLKIEGGDKGLLKNPKTCGTPTVKSVFESHSKKQAIQEIPIAIEGCTDPSLDAELSTRKRGANTNLDLSLSPSLTPVSLDSVEFQLARHLHWGVRKNASASAKKKAKALSVGTITFDSPGKDTKLRLTARRSKRGNVSFVPLKRSGQSLGELSAFTANLVRTRRRQPQVTARGKSKKNGKRVRRQADLLVLSGMPKGDLTGVELELKGESKSRSFYLKNPTGCKRPLNFVAQATTTDGKKIALSDKVKLRCPKRKAGRG